MRSLLPTLLLLPSRHSIRITLQVLSHWQQFRDLKIMFPSSRRAEQVSLHSQQRIVVCERMLTPGVGLGIYPLEPSSHMTIR
jgi:hypothetical protein